MIYAKIIDEEGMHMKIIVTADTHLPEKNRKLPNDLLEACQTADLIIHAGDWSSLDVYETLSTYAKVEGVFGNVDTPEVKQFFPKQKVIETNGFRIGVVHGHGEKMTTEKRAREAFSDESTDIIIFGHSHIPMIRYFGNELLMNSGSPTYKRKLPYYSYGVLEIGERFHSRIVFF